MRKSFLAVGAGVLFVFIVTTLVDVALHLAGAFPPVGQPLDDNLALLATSYRIVIGIAGAWLTARLAPSDPMKHAMILGVAGVILASIGAAVTWNLGLGPRWYPVLLIVLSLPQCWAGGKIHAAMARRG
jgi:MFS family permease